MQTVSCQGAPRDLGVDQGRACRDAICADAKALGWESAGGWRAWWARHTGGAAGAAPALGRDLARHFPHCDERLTGLAAGSGLPRDALLVLLEEELRGDAVVQTVGVARGPAGAPIATLRLRTPLPPTGLVARVCRPDGGYPNLSVARPALAAALAGVNQRGLAAAVELLDPPVARARAGQGAPSLLLLDQCLERLDSVETALEWCERRPGGGRARMVFVDAAGASGALELDGERRTRIAPPSLAPSAGGNGSWALLDPKSRSIELRLPSTEPERIGLDGGPVSAGES